tara:strand:- start:33 stop:992 length:960 start_codon:yes stop_codon:yes gene_type:complete
MKMNIFRSWKLAKKIIFNKDRKFFENFILLFYETGCYFQKRNKFIADLFFKFPYYVKSFFGLKNLNFRDTCLLFFCDKAKLNRVSLAENYDRFFFNIKKEKLKILEIGIGGHTMTDRGGSSLRALSSYFKNSKVYGIDLIDKSLHERNKIKTFKGSQIDEEFLLKICKDYGPFDIIIDDGSHLVPHQKKSFEILFKSLGYNGIYIVEDIGSAYIKYLGGSVDIHNKENLINYFLEKTHNVYSFYIDDKNEIKKSEFIEISSIQYWASTSSATIVIEKAQKNKTAGNVNLFKYTIEEIKKIDPENSILRKSDEGVMKQNN